MKYLIIICVLFFGCRQDDQILVNKLTNGDVINGGIYDASGFTEFPIIVYADNVTISNIKSINTKKHSIVIYGSNVTIKDSFFDNCGSYRWDGIIEVDGSINTKIDNCTFIRNRSVGIKSKNSIYTEISNNVFDSNFLTEDIYKNKTNGMEYIILINDDHETSSFNTVNNNVFKNYLGDKAEIISVKSSNNTIKNNHFFNCMGSVTLRHGNNNFISNNTFFKTDGGVRVYGYNHIIIDNSIINPKKFTIQIKDKDSDIYVNPENITTNRNVILF